MSVLVVVVVVGAAAAMAAGGEAFDNSTRWDEARLGRQLLSSRFSVIVDAGSTGSRAYVYERLSDVDLAGSRGAKQGPGLASLVGESRDAIAAYLRPLVDFAADRVPEDEWRRTPIRVYATAGMRLVDAASAAALYDDCFAVLSGGAFTVDRRDLRTISGEAEAFYAGVAANYAMGTINADRKFQERQTFDLVFGALDLGGASTQVALPVRSNRRAPTAPLEAVDFEARTFLGYGIERVAAKYDAFLNDVDARLGKAANIDDPCAPAGFGRDLPPPPSSPSSSRRAAAAGSGAPERCALALADALGFGDCYRERLKRRSDVTKTRLRRYTLQTCALPRGDGDGDHRDAGAVYEAPAVEPGARFVATSLYYYAWRTLQTTLPRAIDLAAADAALKDWAAAADAASSDFLKQWPAPSLDAAGAAARALCEAPWTLLEAVAKLDAPWDAFMGDAARRLRELPRRCFELQYVQLLLGDVFGVDFAANAVAVAVDVHGVELDWTLGAVLQGEQAPNRKGPPPKRRPPPSSTRPRPAEGLPAPIADDGDLESHHRFGALLVFLVAVAVLACFLAYSAPAANAARGRSPSPSFPRRPSRSRFLGVEKVAQP